MPTRLGLVADEPASGALRRRVRALQRALDRRLARLAQGIDVRTVHESRIAARRLRVVLHGFARVLEPAIARPYHDAVAEIADALEDLRDADVAVQQIEALADREARGSTSAHARSIQRRTRARRALRVALRTEAWRRRAAAMRAAAANPALVLPSRAPVGELGRGILERRRRRTRRALRALRDPRRHPRAAHRLRLEIKALRYLAEECRTAASGPPVREIERLHELQDVLGELRDIDALRDELDVQALQRRRERRARVLQRKIRRCRRVLLDDWRRA